MGNEKPVSTGASQGDRKCKAQEVPHYQVCFFLQKRKFCRSLHFLKILFYLESLTWSQNAIDKFLPWNLPIMIFILFTEKVHNTWLVMVHPAHISASPFIEIEIFHALELKIKKQIIRQVNSWAGYYYTCLLYTSPSPRD